MAAVNGQNGKKPLTFKQEQFCKGIVLGLTQIEAYRGAYNCSKMTRKSVNELASRAMNDVNIISRIAELRAPGLERVTKNYAEWLQEVERVAFYDIGELFDALGNPVGIPDLSPEAKRAIVGFEIEELFIGKKTDETRTAAGYVRKYKLANKLQALELFGRATGFYQEKVASPLSALEATATEVLTLMLADYKNRIGAKQIA